MQNSMLAGVDERSNLYDYFKQDEYCSKFLYGFQWHVPYLNMLTTLLHQKGRTGLGFAVMPSGEMIGAPSSVHSLVYAYAMENVIFVDISKAETVWGEGSAVDFLLDYIHP